MPKFNCSDSVDSYPPLATWLTTHHAQRLWTMHDRARTVEAWIVNGRIALIVLFADKRGWEIYSAVDTIDIQRTLDDAAQRLGLKQAAQPTK